jgi:hypothetical protein
MPGDQGVERTSRSATTRPLAAPLARRVSISTDAMSRSSREQREFVAAHDQSMIDRWVRQSSCG